MRHHDPGVDHRDLVVHDLTGFPQVCSSVYQLSPAGFCSLTTSNAVFGNSFSTLFEVPFTVHVSTVASFHQIPIDVGLCSHI